MDGARKGQRWVLDALIGSGGLDVLHPGAAALFEQIGYNMVDLDRVFSQIESTAMAPGAWARVAGEVEARAQYWRGRGYDQAALALYKRALVLFGRTQYLLRGERRTLYRKRLLGVFEQVRELTSHVVERVVLPFEDKAVHGVFQAPPGAKNAPCVIFLPGMDMFKEDWFDFIGKSVLARGWTGFAFDGPGQGETLTDGLKMKLDNYEAAVSAAIDWLAQRAEVDASRVVLCGSSMGSWWGLRATASDPRIRAIACNMTNLGEKSTLLQQAQPSFFAGLSYMTGIDDPDELDSFAKTMGIEDHAAKVSAPFLVVAGENDELTTLEATLDIYQRVKGPRELWVYEREFHPIGPTSGEWLPATLDWLGAALAGRGPPIAGRQIFITKDGRYLEGDGLPPWWKAE
jgi:dienelactone hydrolase